jgi:hypothetical protein
VIHIFAERDTVELVERGLVEPFTDAVRLRALGLGVRVTTEQKIIRAKVGLLELVKQLDNVSVKLLRVLTDRGSEFCGNPERHEYELYLAVEDIDHSRTKTKSPQTNGICERFHKTALNEFYRVAFRKKVCRSTDELQADLDAWIKEYNEARPHQGRWCLGKTPMQTFLDAMPMTKEKMIAA